MICQRNKNKAQVTQLTACIMYMPFPIALKLIDSWYFSFAFKRNWWYCTWTRTYKTFCTSRSTKEVPELDPMYENFEHFQYLNPVPKIIDFPRYNMKCSGESGTLRGIFRVISRFPLHFVLSGKSGLLFGQCSVETGQPSSLKTIQLEKTAQLSIS